MPQNAWSPKRERQYEHIKESEEERGRTEDKAEQIAAATVNKTRRRARRDQGAARQALARNVAAADRCHPAERGKVRRSAGSAIDHPAERRKQGHESVTAGSLGRSADASPGQRGERRNGMGAGAW